MNIDELERVGGTPAGEYLALAPDVLLARPNPGYVQSASGARKSLAEMNRIARRRGRKQVLLVLVDNVQSQDAESRRVWQNELDSSLICGLALVCSSLLARAIGSFFIGIRRPVVASAMVATLDEGVAWAQEALLRNGGPIGHD